jgi:hypothetical protein
MILNVRELLLNIRWFIEEERNVLLVVKCFIGIEFEVTNTIY